MSLIFIDRELDGIREFLWWNLWGSGTHVFNHLELRTLYEVPGLPTHCMEKIRHFVAIHNSQHAEWGAPQISALIVQLLGTS